MYNGKIDSKLMNAFVDRVITSCEDELLNYSEIPDRVTREIDQFIKRHAGQYSEDVKNVIVYDLVANFNNQLIYCQNVIVSQHIK